MYIDGSYKVKTGAQALFNEAVRVGYRLIDTAPGYGNHDELGKFLNSDLTRLGLKREDLFITTKLAPASQGMTKAKEAVSAALASIGVSYLDLYLIHWPGVSGKKPTDSSHPELRKESWKTMEELHHEGVLRSIGVSNYTVRHLEELLTYCRVKPAVNQVEFHPHLFQSDLLDYCKRNDICLQAYSSLGAAEGVTHLLTETILVDIGQKHNKSPAQVALRWAIQHGIAIIPKSSKADRIQENADIFDFEMSSEEMKDIDSLNRNKHYCWDPTDVI